MVEKNLKNVINGKNFSLIGYGYQNSDKIHTLIGTKNDKGIFWQIIDWLRSNKIKYTISFSEISEKCILDPISFKKM